MAAITNILIADTGWTAIGTAGNVPIRLYNASDTTITARLGGAGDTFDILPKDSLEVGAGVTCDCSHTGVGDKTLKALRAIRPFRHGSVFAYDASTDSLQGTRLNPESHYVQSLQKVASALGDGVYDEYIDAEYYNQPTIQITDTPGIAGTNTYKIFASAQNDGTAQASVEEVDVGTALFGAASWTADAFLPATRKFRSKYIHIQITRTADTANTDGGYQIDIMDGNG